ncbi:hypothetical protein EfmAA290_14430 [Enterococcus faecium]|nr:hypothetical protein EfmAA290_14430 [Enterococcus faecium]
MKLAAIDLDGTLLDRNGKIPEENIQALRKFDENGGIVTVATGRNSISAKDIFSELGIGGYLISSNGSLIAEMKDGKMAKVLRRSKIDSDTLRKAFFYAQEAKISIIASRETQDDQLTFDESNLVKDDPYYEHFNLQNHSFDQILNMLEDPSLSYLKLALTDKSEEKLQKLQRDLQADGIQSVFSDPHFLEITPTGITKAHSLVFLADYLGIESSDIMAFGDQENDIAMLNYSGLSIAMGNAQRQVKEIANQVTLTNEEAGVAYILKNLSFTASCFLWIAKDKMGRVIIDMQNHILDPNSEFYIPESDQLAERIAQRLAKARQNNEYILFTRDIPVELKDKEEEREDLQLIPLLSPQENERVIKKYYFTIPPETLAEIQETLFESKEEQKEIEVVGIETNLCVLSNLIGLQSAFPEADFFVDPMLVSSRKHGESALELLKDFNVSIVES